MTFWPIIAVALLVVFEFWGETHLFPAEPKNYFDLTNHAINIAIIVGIAAIVDRAIRIFYWHGYLKRRRNRDTPELIQDIVTVALILIGLALGFWWQAGLSFTGIAAASGAVAFVLGIALQPVIQDLFSGLSINFDGSYTLGDIVTVYSDQMPEPAYGRVTGISWRTTFVTLEDGRRMMIPNRVMTSNPVANHSRPPAAKRLSIDIPVEIRLPQDKVVHLLLGEAMKVTGQPGLSQQPRPEVLIRELTSDAAIYEVRFYHLPDRINPGQAKSIMFKALHEMLQQRDLPLPVTQVELTQPPGLEFQLGPSQVREALRRVRLFRDALDDQELDMLASQCRPRTLPAGTVLMQQGEPASSMFVIVEGAASISLRVADGASHDVAVSASGDVAGEMSLMTGAPRSATVAALTQMVVLEITREAMKHLLDSGPELYERFSAILAQRQRELDELAERHSDSKAIEVDILTRMRDFFRSFGIG